MIYKIEVSYKDYAQIKGIFQKQNEFIEKINSKINTYVDGVIISSGLNFDGGNWKGFNISETDYDKIMDTNLKGVFFLIRNYANYMHARKIKGNILDVSIMLP